MDLARTHGQLGAALRRRRKSLGLSQDQLAESIHARQGTISRLEGGEADAKLSTLLQVMAALDLELIVRPRSAGKAADIAALF
jgi:HTH-type transcriptional regulator/antitoxin HipB